MQKRVMIGAMFAFAMSMVVAPHVAAQGHSADEIAKATPSGTIEFEAEQMRLIIGGGSGKGVLTYQGKTYPFTFKAATVGGIGVTKAKGVGTVYFMNKLEDFTGSYSAIGAGATLGGGRNANDFENNKGVYISVKSTTEGIGLSLGVTRANVEFVK
jgi:hypothetical protein